MEPRLLTHVRNFHSKAGTTFACVMSQLGGVTAPPLGTALPWAGPYLATHGPRGYFYALVTQLPISDLRSTVICVEVTIRSVFGALGS